VAEAVAAAARTRASRQRRKAGGALATIDLDAASIARLIALGWLAAGQQRDRDAVSGALAAFVRHELMGDDPGPPLYQPTFGEKLAAALAMRPHGGRASGDQHA
jgi:hypothetical protein